MTAEHVREVITPKTKAVIAVHLFGNVAPIEEIAALGLPVIEDAAQSAGTRLADGRRPGALGTIATFSFFPSKNLGAFGDGGAVTTDDDELAEKVEHYRFHGSKDKRTFVYVGHNSRLDALQAGILRVQLPHLDAWADGRRAAAQAYAEAGLGRVRRAPRARTARAARLAPLRGALRARRRADRRAQGQGHRHRGLLPRPGAPAARDARLPADGRAARAPRRPRARTSRSR